MLTIRATLDGRPINVEFDAFAADWSCGVDVDVEIRNIFTDERPNENLLYEGIIGKREMQLIESACMHEAKYGSLEAA